MKTVTLLSFLALAVTNQQDVVLAFAPSATISASSTQLMMASIQTPPELDIAVADMLIQMDRVASFLKSAVSLPTLQQKKFIIQEETQAVAQVQKVLETAATTSSEELSSNKPLVDKAVAELEVALIDMTKAADSTDPSSEEEFLKGIADLQAATLQVVDNIPSMSQEALETTTATAQSASAVLAQINFDIENSLAASAAMDTAEAADSGLSFLASAMTESSDAVAEMAGSAVSEAMVQMGGVLVDVAEAVTTSLP